MRISPYNSELSIDECSIKSTQLNTTASRLGTKPAPGFIEKDFLISLLTLNRIIMLVLRKYRHKRDKKQNGYVILNS
jgi:hypothetical protein